MTCGGVGYRISGGSWTPGDPARGSPNDNDMTKHRWLGVLCLCVGVLGAGAVLFTELTHWLLGIGGPYLGMAVGTAFVMLAFAGFALMLARS